jgi:peroxiredoxin
MTEVSFVEPRRQSIVKEGWIARKAETGNPKDDKLSWYTLEDTEYLCAWSDESWRGMKSAKLKACIPLEGAQVDYTDKPFPTITIKTKSKKVIQLYGRGAKELEQWRDGFLKIKESAKTIKERAKEWKKDSTLASFVPDGDITDEELEQIDPPDLKYITLRTIDGRAFSFQRILENKVVMVVLLRHFGCIFSHQTIDILKDKKNLFDKLGIQIIVVGMGTPQDAANFKKSTGYSGTIYVDSKQDLYRATNCKRGAKYVLSPNSKEAAKKVFAKNYKMGEFSGDFTQLGGLFISSDDAFIYEFTSSFAGDLPDWNAAFSVSREYVKKHPIDTWSTRPRAIVKRTWVNVFAENSELKKITPVKCDLEDWNFELGRNGVCYNTPVPEIEDLEEETMAYKQYFQDKEHMIYLGEKVHDENDDTAFIISILPNDQPPLTSPPSSPNLTTSTEVIQDTAKVLFMTKQGLVRTTVPSYYSEKEMLYYILQKQAIVKEKEELVDWRILKITEPMSEEISMFETLDMYTQYKFGVLYVTPGQSDENDMFCNREESQEFSNFLTLLGAKIELKGFDKFRGGLDVQTDTTGKHSIYQEYNGFEIMFHVSTLLPYSTDDPQQIERKRHLGNDVAVIVFKEGSQKFDPTCIKSHFNHVFIVIEPFTEGDKVKYRVAIANKQDVPPYSPFLPDPPVFEHTATFSDFLLSKLINAERASMYAPPFKEKTERTRQTLIKDIFKNYYKGKKSKTRRTPSMRKIGKSLKDLISIEKPVSPRDSPRKESKPEKSKDFRKSISATNLLEQIDRERLRQQHFDGPYSYNLSESASALLGHNNGKADDDSEKDKDEIRLVIINKKNPQDNDFVVLTKPFTLDQLLDAASKAINKTVLSLDLKGVTLKEKHVQILRDLDQLDVAIRE